MWIRAKICQTFVTCIWCASIPSDNAASIYAKWPSWKIWLLKVYIRHFTEKNHRSFVTFCVQMRQRTDICTNWNKCFKVLLLILTIVIVCIINNVVYTRYEINFYEAVLNIFYISELIIRKEIRDIFVNTNFWDTSFFSNLTLLKFPKDFCQV